MRCSYTNLKICRLEMQVVVLLRGGGLGDLHVMVILDTPTKLTPRQKELLKEFDDCSDANSNPIHDKFVEKIKNLFS